MINVLHLRDTDRICGPGKTILESCTRVDSARFHLAIGLFLGPDEQDNVYYKAAEERGIEVIPIRTRGRFDFSAARQIADIARRRQFDLVHSHEYKSDVLTLMAARIYDVPIVSTAHGWITNDLKSRLMIGLGKRALRFFDRTIAVSPAIYDELRQAGVPEERLRLVYNAIVMENYRPENVAPGELRRRFGLPPQARLIGKIGRLSPEKGQADFLMAATRVARDFPDVYFVLVGDGRDRARLEALAREQGLADRVLFTGHCHDVRPVFRDLDIVALTSHTEGFPNVILESLCMGKPVVATAVGGVPDIVEDRVTGHLVAPGDCQAIAQRLSELLKAPQTGEVMVENGRRRVRERFEFGQRVERLQGLYEEVLTSNRASLAQARAKL